MPRRRATELRESATAPAAPIVEAWPSGWSDTMVRDAVQAALNERFPPAEGMGPRFFVLELFDDVAVGVDHADASFWRFPFLIDVERAAAVLGDGSQVRRRVVYDPVAEAGRVLSRQNEATLRSALDALQSVLAQLIADETLAEEAGALVEVAAEGIVLPLEEARAGTRRIKIIAPGWGSSGYYAADVLRRDGPKVFRAGLHMYRDHPTRSEETERPERSIDELAAVLASDAEWRDDPDFGPGLYADSRIFSAYEPVIREKGDHIGVSIRALGRAVPGEAEGRTGTIIDELTAARSVDFVTLAGAGGRVLPLSESARTGRIEEGTPMDLEREVQQLRETVGTLRETVATLTESRAAEQDRLRQQDAELARLRERGLLYEAREFVVNELAGQTMPELTRRRLTEQLARNPVVADGAIDRDAYRAHIAEAVAAELQYVATVAGGARVIGMGESAREPSAEDSTAKLGRAFAALGLSEAAAARAAAGR